jgi:hypothetical protein
MFAALHVAHAWFRPYGAVLLLSSGFVTATATACSGTDATAVGEGASSGSSGASSGTAALGESCKTTTDCVAGASCGKDKRGRIRCLKVCTDEVQCGGTKDCEVVDDAGTRACIDDDFYD